MSANSGGSGKEETDEYAAFNTEARGSGEGRRRGPSVGSEVWASDVARRAAAITDLTRGWDTRGRVDSATTKEEAYARFLEQEREEQAARARANSLPEPDPVVPVAPAIRVPPKLGLQNQRVEGPRVKVQASSRDSENGPRGARTPRAGEGEGNRASEPLLPSADC